MNFRIGICAATAIILGGAALPAHAEITYGSAPPPSIVPRVITTATSTTTTLISTRIAQVVSGVTTNLGGTLTKTSSSLQQQDFGKAAGDLPDQWGWWTNVSNTWMYDDQPNANFHGRLQNVIAGLDRRVTDDLLVGITLGYEHPDIRTDFNGGTFNGHNVAVAPYAAYVLDDIFSVDASGGYVWLNYAFSRQGAAITGNTGGGRWFGAANFNANTTIDAWQLGASLGYLYIYEQEDAYQEHGIGGNAMSAAQVRLGQVRGTVRGGYLFDTSWGQLNPYASIRLEYDDSKTPASVVDTVGTFSANSRFGTTFTGGINGILGNGMTVGLQGETTEFRDHLNIYTLSGTFRIRF